MLTRTDEVTEPRLGCCRACSGAQQETLFVHSGYPVCACQSCGLVFLNPQPSDGVLADIYSAGYFLESGAGTLEDDFAGLRRRTARLHLDAISRYGGPTQGRLLDVGCGKGDLLLEATAQGFEVCGVDVSPHAVRVANARLGRDAVTCSTLTDAKLPSDYFDVAVCVDALEHVRDPAEYLSQLRRVIKADGVMLLVTPTLDSWPARLMRRWWFEFKTEHLYYFS